MDADGFNGSVPERVSTFRRGLPRTGLKRKKGLKFQREKERGLSH